MTLTFSPDAIEIFPHAAIGEVEKGITSHQRGRVQFMGTTWFARFYQPHPLTEALPGTAVRVVGREGLTLLVIPMDTELRSLMTYTPAPTTHPAGLWHLMHQFVSWFAV